MNRGYNPKRLKPEEAECISFMDELSRRWPDVAAVIFHIENETNARPSIPRMNIRKAMGVRRGVSDYFLPMPSGDYHGLWLEMKATPAGKLSEHQQHFLTQMNKVGYRAERAGGAEAAVGVVGRYLGRSIDSRRQGG